MNPRLKTLPLPDELKIENYDRVHHPAVFDRVDQAVEFIPGKDGIGAIVKSFIYAIRQHDVTVKKIEEKLHVIDGIKREFRKKNRLFRNFDNAWTAMYDPTFEEYLDLKPKMLNIDARIDDAEDLMLKSRLVLEKKRFLELEPRCSNLEVVRDDLVEARNVRDDWLSKVQAAEKELNSVNEEERVAAMQVSDDHIVADERAQSLSQMFPNVQEGFILSNINDDDVESEPYTRVLEIIKTAKHPHCAKFRRYDFRFEPFTGHWYSLPELREMGVCVEQPLIGIKELIYMAGAGDILGVKGALQRGANPNNSDHTGLAPLHVAAANEHFSIMQLLLRAGSAIDIRDKNMMTPLLYAVKKGHVDMSRQLMELGADREASDRSGRGALFEAVTNGSENIVRVFLKKETCNQADYLWKGLTAEEVAADAGHLSATSVLCDERLRAPAQLVHSDKATETEIWIGELAALDPGWSAHIGVTNVVLLTSPGALPVHAMGWLRVEGQRPTDPLELAPEHLLCLVDAADDDCTDSSWGSLGASFREITDHCLAILKRGSATILICDPTGDSTSAAVFAALMLLRAQERIPDSVAKCVKARPSVRLSVSMRHGLEALQGAMDQRKIERLNHKLRHSDLLMHNF